MLYQLFTWLNQEFNVPGAGMFQFLTFRIAMAVLLSLIIATVFGKKLIEFLQKKQIGETVRELGLQGEQQKKGTPTMGGIIILLSILIPTLLFANLDKVYIRLMILCTVWLGIIGFLDDYFKIKSRRDAQKKGEAYKKKDSDGLAGITKIIGQVGLGIIIGVSLYFSNAVTVEREIVPASAVSTGIVTLQKGERIAKDSNIIVRKINGVERRYVKVKTPITSIPFVKNHEFNYSKLISWIGPGAEKYTWIIYIFVVTFIITAVSNGANITDGLDGLAAGVSAIIGMALACIGFLWYNAYPAQVFMGDTGSLALGGIIASLAIIVRKELLIPIFCGVFLIELLSVMIQVSYFKYTKKKFGEGKRVFLMSPLHHHYQKKGFHESKIAVRFWIITILCVVLAILTLKMR